MENLIVLASDFSGLGYDRLFRYAIYGAVALFALIGAVWLGVRLTRRK